jgi:predicted transcriptional regulator
VAAFAFNLWLACYTQEEIAEKERITQEGVRDVLKDLSDFGKLAENAKVAALHQVDFEIPTLIENTF